MRLAALAAAALEAVAAALPVAGPPILYGTAWKKERTADCVVRPGSLCCKQLLNVVVFWQHFHTFCQI